MSRYRSFLTLYLYLFCFLGHGLCQVVGHLLNLYLALCHGLGHGIGIFHRLHHGHRIGLGHALGLSMPRSCYF
jgi:hypothetical protein